jgi:predicted RNA binding protein YcfA (HicA-like mRNA interferase family)
MFGCQYKRKEGSHHILTFPEAKRAVVIPEYDEIDVELNYRQLQAGGFSPD